MDGTVTYADLDELLEEYGDVLETLQGVDELSALAREVKLASVTVLIQARDPRIVHPEDDRFPLFLEALDGASAEVEAVTGPDPQPAARRRLALRAIALATAADLEESLFPEQQLGDGARAAYLRRRYDTVMGALAGSSDPDTGVTSTAPRPRGSFPPAPGYPDPALGRSGRTGRGVSWC